MSIMSIGGVSVHASPFMKPGTVLVINPAALGLDRCRLEVIGHPITVFRFEHPDRWDAFAEALGSLRGSWTHDDPRRVAR